MAHLDLTLLGGPPRLHRRILPPDPKRRRLGLYYQVHLANIRAPEVCAFLRHLLRHLRGAVIVLWDNGRIHRGPLIRDLCRAFPRLRLVRFPPYAPELNPDEGVWSLAKAGLAKCRPDDVDILRVHLLGSLTRMRRSQPDLRGSIAQADMSLFLP